MFVRFQRAGNKWEFKIRQHEARMKRPLSSVTFMGGKQWARWKNTSFRDYCVPRRPTLRMKAGGTRVTWGGSGSFASESNETRSTVLPSRFFCHCVTIQGLYAAVNVWEEQEKGGCRGWRTSVDGFMRGALWKMNFLLFFTIHGQIVYMLEIPRLYLVKTKGCIFQQSNAYIGVVRICVARMMLNATLTVQHHTFLLTTFRRCFKHRLTATIIVAI